MREILFKAKRLDSGEWVEGHYVSHRGCCHFIIPLPFGGYIAKDSTFMRRVRIWLTPPRFASTPG